MATQAFDPGLFLGLISGTSMDGVDAALLRMTGLRPELLGFIESAYPNSLKESLELVVRSERVDLDEFGQLNVRVGMAFADAANQLLTSMGIQASQVAAIGSHGQTLIHKPWSSPPHTLQIGDPSLIAYRTGIVTVADFRMKDMVAGGHGAPLVPAFHRVAFGHQQTRHVVVNIGGIANITAFAESGDVVGFDTGPGNTLLDIWISRHLGKPFDSSGDWAAKGVVHEALLQKLLDDDYFSLTGPRSSGRDYFNLAWLETKLNEFGASNLRPVDVQATLLQLTARSISRAINTVLPHCSQAAICGGGARNLQLMATLAELIHPARVCRTDDLGIPSDAVEACAFAWLAAQRLASLPGNVPSVTGAKKELVLGGIYHPG